MRNGWVGWSGGVCKPTESVRLIRRAQGARVTYGVGALKLEWSEGGREGEGLFKQVI